MRTLSTVRLLLILGISLFLSPIQAATLTGMVQKATGGWATNSVIAFFPSNTPAVLNGGFTLSASARMVVGSNGWASNNLLAGNYRFSIDQSTRDFGTIYVPDSADTFNLWSLTTSTNIGFLTNISVFVTTIKTNGVTVGGKSILNFIPGSNVVLQATQTTSSIDIKINAAAAGVTDAQLISATNQLQSVLVANDTTTSNGVLTAARASDAVTSNSLFTGSRSINTHLSRWHQAYEKGTNLNLGYFGDSTRDDVSVWVANLVFSYVGTNGLQIQGHYNVNTGTTNVASSSSTNWFGPVEMDLWTNSAGPGTLASTNGTSPFVYADTFQAAFIQRTNGGTFLWQTKTNHASSNWVTRLILSSSNAFTAVGVITNFMLTPGWYQSQFVYSNSGITKFVRSPDLFDSTSRGLRVFDLGLPGSRIDQIVSTPTNISIPILRGLNLALVWWEGRDGSNTVASVTDGLPAFHTLIQTACTNADELYTGVAPIAENDYEMVGQNSVARSVALTNGAAFFNYRDMPDFQTTNTMILAMGAFDGLHPNALMQYVMTDFALKTIPIITDRMRLGAYAGGVSRPAGARGVWLAGGNEWSGLQTVNGTLQTTGVVYSFGTGSGFHFDDQNTPGTALRWRLDAFNGDARFIRSADSFFRMGTDADNYRSFSPMSGVETIARNGTRSLPWFEVWGSNHMALNSFIVGPNTNIVCIVSNSSPTGPGVAHWFRTTNGGLVFPAYQSVNLTNGNVGIGTATPVGALDVAGEIRGTNVINRANGAWWATVGGSTNAQWRMVKNGVLTNVVDVSSATWNPLTHTFWTIHNNNNGRLTEWNLDGVFQRKLDWSASQISDGEEITWMGGNLYAVSDEDNNRIVVFSITNNASGGTISTNNSTIIQTVASVGVDGPSGIEGLAWDPDRNVWWIAREKTPAQLMTLSADGSVTNNYFTTAQMQTFTNANHTDFSGLSLDRENQLLAVSQDEGGAGQFDRVLIIDLINSNLVATIDTTNMGQMEGVSWIGDGRLLVTGEANQFAIYEVFLGGLNSGESFVPNAQTNLPATKQFPYGITVGLSGGLLTNTLYVSATLDFPSTVAGTVSDMPITLAGAADGDIVALGEPSGSIGPLTGVYNAWASNGVVYVRFANNNLVTAQDPASGTFKVRVDKFR